MGCGEMSGFSCDVCSFNCVNLPFLGYVTGCEHNPCDFTKKGFIVGQQYMGYLLLDDSWCYDEICYKLINQEDIPIHVGFSKSKIFIFPNEILAQRAKLQLQKKLRKAELSVIEVGNY